MYIPFFKYQNKFICISDGVENNAYNNFNTKQITKKLMYVYSKYISFQYLTNIVQVQMP